MKLIKYLIPLAIIVLALVYWRTRNDNPSVTSPPVPPSLAATENTAEADRILSELTAVYDQATATLTGVKDAASADAAVGQLQALGPKIDKAQTVWSQVPESFRPKFRPVAAAGYEKLKAAIDRTLAIPGVGEKLRPTTDQLLAKLKTFA